MKFLFLLLAFIAGSAFGASVPLVAPSNVVAGSGGWVTAGSASFNGSAFNSAFTTNVAGKAVTVPATWRLASNAGQFAVNAIRISPSGLLGTAVAAFLIPYGVEWVNEQWQKSQQVSTGTETIAATAGATVCFDGPGTAYRRQNCSACDVPGGCSIAGWAGPTECNVAFVRPNYPDSPTGWCGPTNDYQIQHTCPAGGGWTLAGKSCTRPIMATQYVPATVEDFVAPSAASLPDPVATEVAAKQLPLPLLDPELNLDPQILPLSDPYTDPVTGKRFRDQIQIRPQSDGKTAEIQVIKQELDPATDQPLVDPQTQSPVKPEDKQEDPCKLNPERIGCKEFGTPEDTDLPTEERGVSAITPQSFGGNASCPADIQLPKGAMFSWSYPCQMATGVKPFLLALAWLAAGLIVIGAVRSS